MKYLPFKKEKNPKGIHFSYMTFEFSAEIKELFFYKNQITIGFE